MPRPMHLRRRARARLRHGGTTGALVLLYHRVAEPSRDPQLLAVSPARFAEHLEVLRSDACPLAELRGRSSGVAITFDDGYADNLGAAELLAGAGLPATVFVTAGLLGQTPWWDELAERLLTDVDPSWSVAAPAGAPGTDRYLESFERLRPLPYDEQRALLGELGAPPSAAAPILTERELADLAAVDGIEIGAHTCTHPVLSTLARAEQRAEIAGSKRRLEELLDRPVTSFAYPYGSRADYDDGTVAAVRDAGFARACVNEPARLRRRCDPFRIPRFLVRDWDGDTFARALREWSA